MLRITYLLVLLNTPVTCCIQFKCPSAFSLAFYGFLQSVFCLSPHAPMYLLSSLEMRLFHFLSRLLAYFRISDWSRSSAFNFLRMVNPTDILIGFVLVALALVSTGYFRTGPPVFYIVEMFILPIYL